MCIINNYYDYCIPYRCIVTVTSHDGHFLMAIKKMLATGVSIMGVW